MEIASFLFFSGWPSLCALLLRHGAVVLLASATLRKPFLEAFVQQLREAKTLQNDALLKLDWLKI